MCCGYSNNDLNALTLYALIVVTDVTISKLLLTNYFCMQPSVCLGMTPTQEELKISYIVELFPMGVLAIVVAKNEPPRKKPKIDAEPPHTTSSSSWTEFQNQILGSMKSMNNRLVKLEEAQKNNERLLK